MSETPRSGAYGLLAEFASADALLDAVRRVKAAGYTAIDAFTPFPVEAISEEIENHHRSKVPLLVLIGALTGTATAFALQYYTSAVDYPVNIGGRPVASWPAWLPVAFEMTVLFAAFTAVVGMLILNRLPEPYHPLFNVERFERASQDRCFLLVETRDPRYDAVATRELLAGLGATEVDDVDW